jgi:dipeptidase E
MPKIVAIGGGELKDLDTLLIDKEIVKLTGKKHPKALFIPTGSGDAEGYWQTFQEVYGKKLGCRTDVLYLIRATPPKKEINEKIFSSDLIYVGGGNTLRLLKRWREKGMDDVLKKAYEKNIVLSGLSAGAICWFNYGTSDSMKYKKYPKKLVRLRCIGLVDAVLSPHHIREPHRKKELIRIMRRTSGAGIALDDNCAIEIIDDEYRIVCSKKNAGAHKCYYKSGKLHYEPIEVKKEFEPLSTLLNK